MREGGERGRATTLEPSSLLLRHLCAELHLTAAVRGARRAARSGWLAGLLQLSARFNGGEPL